MSITVPVRPRRRLALGACAGVLALGLAACGGSGDKNPDPAQAVPASVPVYIQATIQPDGDLKTDVENISKRLFGSSDIAALINKQADAAGDDAQELKDLQAWVGSRAGLFVSGVSADSADAAVVVAIADKDAAQKSLDENTEGDAKKTYKDVDYYADKEDPTSVSGIVGDYGVFGTERAVKIVIDTVEGDDVAKIGDAKNYQDALAAIGDTDDALGTFYATPQGLLEAFARSGGIPSSALAPVRQSLAQAGTTWAAKLGVSENAIGMDFAALGVKAPAGGATDAGDASAALQALPGDAWLGAGVGAVGAQLRTAIQQGIQTASVAGQDVQGQLTAIEQQLGISLDDDLLSWMGDAGFFARGTSIASIGGALVVQTSDPAKSAAAITKISRLVEQVEPTLKVTPVTNVKGADSAVSFSDPSLPFPLIAAVGGDKFVVGVGQQAVEAALSPSTTLADSASYKQAASALDGVDPTFFLDIAPVTQLLRGLGIESDPEAAKVLTALEKLGSISAGAKVDGTTVRSKLVLTLPE